MATTLAGAAKVKKDKNMLNAPRDIVQSLKKSQKQQRFLFTLCLLLCVCIFAYDIKLPLGYAGGVPYVAVILVALRLSRYHYAYLFAVICSCLTILGYFISPEGGLWWVVLLNRALALFVIWVTAILGSLQKQSQTENLETEIRFKLMADTAPLMIWQSDLEDKWEFLSEAWFEYLDENASHSTQNYLKLVHKSDRQQFFDTCQQARNHQSHFQVELRLWHIKEGNFRWMLVHGAPLVDEDGNFSGHIGSCMDISSRKKTEKLLAQTQKMFAHQDKMSSIGEMAAGILHEVGNPAAAIHGLAEAAITETESATVSSELKEYLISIVKQTERISSLTQEVSELAAPVEVAKQLFNVNDVVNRSIRLMRFDKKFSGVRVVTDFDSNMPAIYGSKDHLNQIVINLATNAGDSFSPNQKEKQIVIKTRFTHPNVIIEVKDTGRGMDIDTLRKAQGPFFTTKSAGKGTGLGLSLCNSLINKFHGEMQIESTRGKGTHVTLSIPVELAEKVKL